LLLLLLLLLSACKLSIDSLIVFDYFGAAFTALALDGVAR